MKSKLAAGVVACSALAFAPSALAAETLNINGAAVPLPAGTAGTVHQLGVSLCGPLQSNTAPLRVCVQSPIIGSNYLVGIDGVASIQTFQFGPDAAISIGVGP